MSEHQPYHPQEPRFSRLPNEDAAWENMKARLDEEERKRRFLLPPFFTGCAGWGVLLMLLLGGGLWWWAVYDDANKEAPVAVQTGKDTTLLQDQKRKVETKTAYPNQQKTDPQQKENIAIGKDSIESNIHTDVITGKSTPLVTNSFEKPRKENKKSETRATAVNQQKTAKGFGNILKKEKSKTEPPAIAQIDIENNSSSITNGVDSISTAFGKKDTTTVRDTTVVAPPVRDSIQQKQPPPQKSQRYFVTAGLTLQQQIPVGDQQWTPYNYRGRKGALADYVPAFDLRLHKGNQWFLQAGFRWGAPHYTRSFVYNRNFKTDTLGSITGSTQYRLHKTYYHQVPISFNYNIRPAFSAGVGVVWSQFFGAISEKEEREQITPTADSLISKTWVRDRNDSLFRSSNVQLLLQVQYQRKRFSVGAQYTQGLQPYIEYRDAQGENKKQKNSALNLFVRYQLWRQKP